MITTLAGNNTFLLKAELGRLTQLFVEKYGDFGLEKLDCEELEYAKITEALQSMPFLAGKKLVVLRNPSAVKEFAEKFENVPETIPDSTDVIIVETKLDKRLSYAKQLKKLTDYSEFSELSIDQLPAWLTRLAKDQGGTLSLADARFLVDRAGANQQMLSNELQKLLSYSQDVTRETIEKLTEERPQSTIFQLVDAACAGDVKKALALYEEQRRLRVEPMAIIGMLAWQFHVLAIIASAGKRTPDQIAGESKLHPFVVRKNLSVARRLGLSKVKDLVHKLYRLETLSKSTPIDIDEALQNFIVELGQ